MAQERFDEARGLVEAHLRLVRASRKEPLLIVHLITHSGMEGARESIWRGMSADAWGSETLQAFAAELLSWNALRDFVWSMESERAFSRELLEQRLSSREQLAQLAVGFGLAPGPRWEKWLLADERSRRGWWRNNQLWFEHAADELATMVDADGIRAPVETRSFDPASLSKAQIRRELPWAVPLIRSFETFLDRSTWVHAQNSMAAIACASKRRDSPPANTRKLSTTSRRSIFRESREIPPLANLFATPWSQAEATSSIP